MVTRLLLLLAGECPLTTAAGLSDTAAVNRLAAATTQADIGGIHLGLGSLAISLLVATIQMRSREEFGFTHRLLSDELRRSLHLHGLLLGGGVDLRHLGRLVVSECWRICWILFKRQLELVSLAE